MFLIFYFALDFKGILSDFVLLLNIESNKRNSLFFQKKFVMFVIKFKFAWNDFPLPNVIHFKLIWQFLGIWVDHCQCLKRKVLFYPR